MVDVEVGADVFLDIGQVSKSPPGVDEDPNFAMSDFIQRRTPDKAQSPTGFSSVDLRETRQVAICVLPPAEALSSRRRWLRAR